MYEASAGEEEVPSKTETTAAATSSWYRRAHTHTGFTSRLRSSQKQAQLKTFDLEMIEKCTRVKEFIKFIKTDTILSYDR